MYMTAHLRATWFLLTVCTYLYLKQRADVIVPIVFVMQYYDSI